MNASLNDRLSRARSDDEIDALVYEAIDSGSARTMTDLAMKVDWERAALLQRGVVCTEEIPAMIDFAAHVPGARIADLATIIIPQAVRLYVLDFLSSVADLPLDATDMEVMQEMVERRGDAEIATHFAARVSGANIAACEEMVIASGDASSALAFARDAPGADIERLQEIVLASGDARTMREFACQVPGADIERLQELVIARGVAAEMIAFARDVPGANVIALHDACRVRPARERM